MLKIKIKRVYEKKENSDGLRVLVDRLWPRGIKKENLSYDLWEKDITPSPELREWYHEDLQGHWSEFAKKYRKELDESEAAKEFVKKIQSEKEIPQNTLTLLYGAKNVMQNHAIVLKDFLESALKRGFRREAEGGKPEEMIKNKTPKRKRIRKHVSVS